MQEYDLSSRTFFLLVIDLMTKRFVEPRPWLDKKYSGSVKISIQELIELIKQ